MSNQFPADSSIDDSQDPRLGEPANGTAYEAAVASHKRISDAARDIKATGKGVYVGFYPPEDVARRCVIPGEVSELKAPHITLCFLGKGMAEDEIADLIRSVERIARCLPDGVPLRVTGSARFAGSRAHVLLVDGANPLQSVLASTLRARGFRIDDTYAFTAHLTLAMENRALSGLEASEQRRRLVDRAAALAEEGIEWTARGISVVAGKAHITFALGG